jgi:hypothetical protein
MQRPIPQPTQVWGQTQATSVPQTDEGRYLSDFEVCIKNVGDQLAGILKGDKQSINNVDQLLINLNKVHLNDLEAQRLEIVRLKEELKRVKESPRVHFADSPKENHKENPDWFDLAGETSDSEIKLNGHHAPIKMQEAFSKELKKKQQNQQHQPRQQHQKGKNSGKNHDNGRGDYRGKGIGAHMVEPINNHGMSGRRVYEVTTLTGPFTVQQGSTVYSSKSDTAVFESSRVLTEVSGISAEHARHVPSLFNGGQPMALTAGSQSTARIEAAPIVPPATARLSFDNMVKWCDRNNLDIEDYKHLIRQRITN